MTLAAVLEEGLRLHLASDVPLAVFLSGGVDSSAIANLAQRAAESPIHTFTLAFEEQELNEGPIAKRIAAAIGTEHHEVVLTEGHFVANLETALDSLDQPTFDGLNAYFMSHAIRDAGFTVALSGTGGDELFGGYTTYRDLPVLHRWSRRAAWVPRGLQVAAAKLATWPLPPLRPGGAAADPLGQASRDGPSRRRSAGALPAGLRAVPSRIPAGAVGARFRRAACRWSAAGDAPADRRRDRAAARRCRRSA